MSMNSILAGIFFVGLVFLPVAGIAFAVRVSKPVDRISTFEETYPDPHLFI